MRQAIANPFVTQAEAAARARLSERTIRRAIAEGRLPAYRVGRRVIVETAAVDRFVRGTSTEHAESNARSPLRSGA